MSSVGGDATLGTSSTIGRYFGIVSAVPSVLLVGWLYLLLSTGPFTTQPSLSAVGRHLSDFHPLQTAALVAGALVFAVVLHPLQFTLVQLLEGYWGYSTVMRSLRARRTATHVQRWAKSEAGRSAAARELRAYDLSGGDVRDVLSYPVVREKPGDVERALQLLVDAEAWGTLHDSYPRDTAHFMPTRLGNMLRRHELLAGASYNLPILRFATHIGMVAAPTHTTYVNDQRTQLDLAVRICANSVLATGVTLALMWPHGLWLLLALIPYLIAWLSYRGALTSASGYGVSLSAWVDLNRFALYEALHLPPVLNTAMERRQNEALIDMLNGAAFYEARYANPESRTGQGTLF